MYTKNRFKKESIIQTKDFFDKTLHFLKIRRLRNAPGSPKPFLYLLHQYSKFTTSNFTLPSHRLSFKLIQIVQQVQNQIDEFCLSLEKIDVRPLYGPSAGAAAKEIHIT